MWLCGQIGKAAYDMSHVVFVHRQFKDTAKESGVTPCNPLEACERILRIYGESCVPATTVWEMVRREQERIYMQVQPFSLYTQNGPIPFANGL
jgi:hypothetical protein